MPKLPPPHWFVIVACAALGALLPLLFVSLVEFMDERVPDIVLAPFVILGWLVCIPGAIFFPDRGTATFLLIEFFWIFLGALGGVLLARVRSRHQHATRKA